MNVELAKTGLESGNSMQERLKSFESQIFIHTTTLLRAATRICQSATEADDIVQETMLRAWKYWDSFESGTNCRAWLFRIMINLIHRRRERVEAHTEHISIDEPEMSNVLRFEARLDFNEEGALSAVAKLPKEYRDVILLVLVEEFAYKEAAVMLNLPMGTVMSRLHRARQILKKMLRPSLGESAAI
jgi:RNA polymerase sigma-70 factor, ECF subfamily